MDVLDILAIYIAFVIALIFLYYAGHSNVELIASKKIVFIFTSIWWLLFMLPLILFLKDDKRLDKLKLSIIQSFKELFSNKKIFYFLAYWVYIDGVDTVIRMAVNYGLTLGFSSSDLLVALLVTQFVSFPGTNIILKISDFFQHRESYYLLPTSLFSITYLAYNLHSAQQFYIIAVLIGFAQGGIQVEP